VIDLTDRSLVDEGEYSISLIYRVKSVRKPASNSSTFLLRSW